jgi:hypothetical protein
MIGMIASKREHGADGNAIIGLHDSEFNGRAEQEGGLMKES